MSSVPSFDVSMLMAASVLSLSRPVSLFLFGHGLTAHQGITGTPGLCLARSPRGWGPTVLWGWCPRPQAIGDLAGPGPVAPQACAANEFIFRFKSWALARFSLAAAKYRLRRSPQMQGSQATKIVARLMGLR